MRLKSIVTACVAALLVAFCLAVAGCGSSQQTLTLSSPAASVTQSPAATASETASTPAPPPASSNYPAVQWNSGPWPFALQISSITKDPEGFMGRGSAEPGSDWLMVRINVTNQTLDRAANTPNEINVECTWPGGPATGNSSALSELDGYEVTPGSRELVLGSNVGMGPGESHIWGAEWEAPENVDTEKVRCIVQNEKGASNNEPTLKLT